MIEVQKLTLRERQILRLLVLGKCVKTMSVELGIADSTVANHLCKLYRKIGVRRREQAISKVLSGETIHRQIDLTLGLVAA